MRNKKTMIYLFTAVLLILAVFLVVYGLGADDIAPFSVVVSVDEETEEINCWQNEDEEYCVFLPGYADLSQVRISLNTETPVSINGIALADGMDCSMFQLGVPYPLTYKVWGRAYERNIMFVQSGGVATMYIDTESGNMEYIHEQKGNEESGTLSLYTADGRIDYAGDLKSINGRGNNTWEEFDKKPYSISLSGEADLLGMGQAQKWILLANAGDSSNIRDKMVHDYAAAVGLAYSPDSQWVDLYLNGEYAGLYLLCERNEVHTERVNIAENGSFLVSLEVDSKLAARNYIYVSTDSGQALRVHYPINPASGTLAAIANTWQSIENAIVAKDGIDPVTGKSWQELIDLDSWTKKYLLEEIFANGDAGAISQYFYLDAANKNGKIFAGPVWDYDHTMGNKVAWHLTNPNSFFANRLYVSDGYSTPWFYSLYQKEAFYNRMIELYQSEFLPTLQDMLGSGIDAYVAEISQASAVNQLRWFTDEDDLFTETEYIRGYMAERIAFLNAVWLDDATYHIVRADQGFGANYANYAVFEGKCLTGLPEFEDTQYSEFLGWYYADTNEPFDITKPIYEDTEIYAKWQDSEQNKRDDIIKLLPLGVIAVLFVILFVIEVRRMRENRRA